MELCTSQTICSLPSGNSSHGFLGSNAAILLRSRISLPLKRNLVSVTLGLQSRILRCSGSFPGETVSEETSTGVNEYGVEKRAGAVVVEEASPVEENVTTEQVPEAENKVESSVDEQTQTLEFLENLKFDSENIYSYLPYGGGALVALYLVSAILGAVDSIPLFPKLMEVVGIGYTVWFTTRYLLFQKNREELGAKIEEIKQQVLGSDSE